jgi:hypothetical protein
MEIFVFVITGVTSHLIEQFVAQMKAEHPLEDLLFGITCHIEN